MTSQSVIVLALDQPSQNKLYGKFGLKGGLCDGFYATDHKRQGLRSRRDMIRRIDLRSRMSVDSSCNYTMCQHNTTHVMCKYDWQAYSAAKEQPIL